MSLRRRLFLVLFLAVVALAAAALAIREVLNKSQARRERDGLSTGETLARSVARGSAAQTTGSIQGLLGTIPDASAGSCTRAGSLGASASNGGWGEPVDHPPPVDVGTALEDLCRLTGALRDTRIEHPHDVTFVTAVDIDEASRAWSVIRVQADTGSRRSWVWLVGILGLATLVLSLVTVDALGALERGTMQLEQGLLRLEGDLRAPVVRPRADELGRVADGLRAMAEHLADARERERSLERRLAHEQRLAALGRDTAGLAHEIRNPLAGLKLRLDIARRSAGVSPEVLSEVSGGLDEVARLDRLVASLLTLGRPSGSRTRFDVGELLDERLRLLGPWAARLNVALRRVGSTVATADRDALARVLDNLVRNAAEANPASEVTVKVTEFAGTCMIEVQDKGPGLTSGIELFEPFSTSKPDGTGLGLFIARSLIEAMGGTITYERESTWTTFRVSLPTS